MAASANFAFCNRQMIMQWVRDVFKKSFPKSKLEMVYDVAHNVAKIEEHVVDGKKMMFSTALQATGFLRKRYLQAGALTFLPQT